MGRLIGMGDARWWVLVEEVRGMGDGREWKVSHVAPVGDEEEARAEALRLAREFTPAYPWSPKSRKVLRLGDGSYLVIVEGRTSSFHFRTRVGELVD
ncbi:hypothetical protein ACFFQW_36440 [Umezawaea endophytica]|uniref:Uncharacterized protein n=1 Tax=Umezawaea endophytica TaxID=1654476 RepID=A0A9X2VLY7_9PSEU|nr:hypothetical protein [Umezawaea endophytica]MCS7478946.1 hypothetical protein [Umezawaea endophytica]